MLGQGMRSKEEALFLKLSELKDQLLIQSLFIYTDTVLHPFKVIFLGYIRRGKEVHFNKWQIGLSTVIGTAHLLIMRY